MNQHFQKESQEVEILLAGRELKRIDLESLGFEPHANIRAAEKLGETFKTSAQIEYRVAGTDDTGSLTLPPGPNEDPGYSETELVTRERGMVELYQDGARVARRGNGATACGAAALSAAMARW